MPTWDHPLGCFDNSGVQGTIMGPRSDDCSHLLWVFFLLIRQLFCFALFVTMCSIYTFLQFHNKLLRHSGHLISWNYFGELIWVHGQAEDKFCIDALVPKRAVGHFMEYCASAGSISSSLLLPSPSDWSVGGNDQAVLQAILSLNTPTPQSLTFPTKFHGRTLNQWRWPLGEESTGGGGGGYPSIPCLWHSQTLGGASCPSRLLQGDP